MNNFHTAIAGATGGVGSHLAQTLKEQGHMVSLFGRSESKLKTLSEKLDSPFHLIDPSQLFQSYESGLEQAHNTSPLTAAVCCTGNLILKPAHSTSETELMQTLDSNVMQAFAMLRSSAKLMMNTQGGSIVLVSSAAAQIGLQNHEAIATAKAAIIGLARSAAATYARYNIRVNAVAPGLTETPLTQKIFSSEPSRKASESMHALGRLGKTDDIVSAIKWLISPEASWVTGQVIGVDGGLGSLKTRQ